MPTSDVIKRALTDSDEYLNGRKAGGRDGDAWKHQRTADIARRAHSPSPDTTSTD